MLLTDVEQHRQQLVAITERSSTDAVAYGRSVMGDAPERAASQVREMAAAVVSTWSGVAAEGAALFYEEQRPKPGPIVQAEPSVGERLAADLGYALAPLFKPDDYDTPGLMFLSRLGGAVTLHVAAGDRATMALTSEADSLSGGVRRYARAGACAFCAYLSTVEAAAYSDTEWHPDCTCVNVPLWGENPFPDTPHMDAYARAAERAQQAISDEYREKRLLAPGLRRSTFYRQFPKTAMNTKNIAARMRQELGLSH